MTNGPAPAWYPDPTGRHQVRYWDGERWTDHVADQGAVSRDPVVATGNLGDAIDRSLTVGNHADPVRIQQQVATATGAGTGAASGGGTLFTEPVLVVNQKAKIIEVTSQYGVFDAQGRPVAFVNQVGQSAAKKALRVLTSLDQFMTHRLEITDRNGAVVMRLTRPAKVFKSTIVVESPTGAEIGRIVQENVFGKIRFGLDAGGQRLGAIQAENWRAWNFAITDAAGVEVGRITKTWEGLAKTLFTTADNYVVQLRPGIPQPLLSLVVASALCVDTALKQDNRGLG